jgi:hypothetical protein
MNLSIQEPPSIGMLQMTPVLGHRILKLSMLASISKLPVPFCDLTVNIPHTHFVVLTCAHPKWQNSQSDDGGRSAEEEEEEPALTLTH